MAMDRREFVQLGVAATLGAAAEMHAAPKKRMNLLYVFSDQHRVQSLPGGDVNAVIAPNLNNFRRENFEMTNCISNYPLCSPYRAILMSGRWPCQTGVVQNGPGLPTTEHGLGEQFRSNGYHTAYVGKWHLHHGGDHMFIPRGPERFGFEDWHMWCDTNAHYASWTYDQNTGERKQPHGYNATLMTDEAVEIIQKQKEAEKPWMMVVSWNPPHPPYNPPDVDRDQYNRDTLKLRPNVKFIKDYIATKKPNFPVRDEAALREAMQGYYGGITAIDLEFARLLKALDETGQADNTIVIYTCDHGELMGSHGRIGKMMPHEESCHVPFFIRIPGITKKGGKSDMLFASIDMYPTLCGLAGVPVPAHCEGKDRSAAMHGRKMDGPEHVFLMSNTGGSRTAESDLPDYRGLRTATHTYAVMADGRWCLYDNEKDPFQMNNLVRDPEYKAMMDKFDVAIQGWLEHTKDPFPLKQAVTKVNHSWFA
ncbi:MAG: sulfatase [Acidobacteria bacterium]|nr:sulfatase [Acidobacteriota bacterium]